MNYINLRNILTMSVMLSLPATMRAQSIHLMPNSKVAVVGPVNLVLNNIGFINDGSFTAGASKVSFTGTAAPTVAVVGGNNNSSFFDVMINKTVGAVLLNRDISVTGIVTMVGGNIQLNTHTLDLGTSGRLAGETDQSRITAEGVSTGGSVLASITSLV